MAGRQPTDPSSHNQLGRRGRSAVTLGVLSVVGGGAMKVWNGDRCPIGAGEESVGLGVLQEAGSAKGRRSGSETSGRNQE